MCVCVGGVLPPVGEGEGGPIGRGSYGGRGQGTFQSSCHILHYHMVLRPKGTSHNDKFEIMYVGA